MTTLKKITKSKLFDLLFYPRTFFSRSQPKNIVYLILLIILGSFWITLSYTLKIEGNYFLKWPQLLVGSLISSTIGWLFLYIYSIFGFLISKILGGKGNINSTFNVLIYSYLPSVFLISIYLLILLFPFDRENYNYWSSSKWFLTAVNLIIWVWFLYIGLNGIAYFHQLSIFKAFLVFLIAFCGPLLLFGLFSIDSLLNNI